MTVIIYMQIQIGATFSVSFELNVTRMVKKKNNNNNTSLFTISISYLLYSIILQQYLHDLKKTRVISSFNVDLFGRGHLQEY